MIYKLFVLTLVVLMIYFIDKIKNWGHFKIFKYPLIIILSYSIMYASTLNFHSVSVYKDDRNLVFYDDSILIKNQNIKIENIEKIGKYSGEIYVLFEKNSEKYLLKYYRSNSFEILPESKLNNIEYLNLKKVLLDFKTFKIKYTIGDKYENK